MRRFLLPSATLLVLLFQGAGSSAQGPGTLAPAVRVRAYGIKIERVERQIQQGSTQHVVVLGWPFDPQVAWVLDSRWGGALLKPGDVVAVDALVDYNTGGMTCFYMQNVNAPVMDDVGKYRPPQRPCRGKDVSVEVEGVSVALFAGAKPGGTDAGIRLGFPFARSAEVSVAKLLQVTPKQRVTFKSQGKLEGRTLATPEILLAPDASGRKLGEFRSFTAVAIPAPAP